MPRPPKTAKVDRASAHRFLEKARQFAEEAQLARDGRRWDAAVLCAIHAGISAMDAISAALAGVRSTDPDHLRAADLLQLVGRGSAEMDQKASQLRSLLRLKNRIEYEDARAKAEDARAAVERAERLVAWTEEQVRKSGA